MKKIFLFAFSLMSFAALSQVTKNPSVDQQSSSETRITRVEITNDATIISFQFRIQASQGGFHYKINPFGRNPLEGIFQPRTVNTQTISIDPDAFLYDKTSKKKFRFVNAQNIPIRPSDKQVFPDELYKFTVIFEKLDKGIENFDLYEGRDNRNSNLKHWNFFGIEIVNPADKIDEVKKESILISGVFYDEETKKPIKGSLAIYSENYNEKIDSLNTSKSGSYNIALPSNDYSYKVYADGYETKEDMLNLAKVKSGNFKQDQYLKKLKEKPILVETKVEPKKDIDTYKEAKVGEIIKMENILFETSQSTLKEESFEELAKLAEAMQLNPELTIRLEGHTDNVGDANLNLNLSLDRVTSVRNYLMNKGIEGKRIAIKGYGGSRPLNKNGSDEDRKINRRVEVVILTK
jgi:OmpA-OmpF porin, OOP family